MEIRHRFPSTAMYSQQHHRICNTECCNIKCCSCILFCDKQNCNCNIYKNCKCEFNKHTFTCINHKFKKWNSKKHMSRKILQLQQKKLHLQQDYLCSPAPAHPVEEQYLNLLAGARGLQNVHTLTLEFDMVQKYVKKRVVLIIKFIIINTTLLINF